MLKHWPALVLFILAISIRSASLDPVFFYGDEAEYGIVAKYLAQDIFALSYPKLNPIEAWPPAPFVSQPPLVLFAFSLAYRVAGASDLTGVWVSILFGAATIPLVYGIGTVLRGRAMGALAGLFLAVMPIHVNLSRKAMLDAGFVFFLTLAALMLTLWITVVLKRPEGSDHAPRRARTLAAAAGLSAGLAALSKLPGVLFMVVLLGALAFVLLLEGVAAVRRDPEWQARLRGILLQGGFGAVAVFACAAAYFLLLLKVNGVDFLIEKLHLQLGRVNPSLAPDGFVEIAAVKKPWHWYFSVEKQNVFALMGGWLVVLAAAGFIASVIDVAQDPRKRGPALVIVLWAVVFLGFLVYSTRKEWFYLLPLAPAFALLAARIPAGLAPLAARLLDSRATRVRRASGAAAAAFLVMTAGLPTWTGGAESLDEVSDVKDKVFGYGTKESAAYIADHSRPGDGQIGSLLGRWSLGYYNGQPTYHFYQQGMLKKLIHTGEIRWLVEDKYLKLAHEDALWYKLKNDCGAQLATKFAKSWGEVYVWQFEPGQCRNPDEAIYIVPPAGF